MKLYEPKNQKPERQAFLAVDNACKAIFLPTPGFKEKPSIALGSQQRGTLIPASMVHCRGWGNTID